MTPKGVWFDLGYTLVHTERERCFYQIAAESGTPVTHDEAKLAFHLADKYFMRERQGVLCGPRESFLTPYFEYLLENAGIPLDPEKTARAFREREDRRYAELGRAWFAYEEAQGVLSELKRRSVATGLISNWDSSARKVLADNGLEAGLGCVIVSSEVGCMKPERAIFEKALEQTGLDPKECLFVGDNYYDDVVGAAKVGMPAVLINPYGRAGIEEVRDVPVISGVGELLPYIESR